MTITNIVKTLFFVVTGHRQNVVDSWSDEERNHFWGRTRAFFDYMQYTYDHVVMFNGMANGVDRMFYNFAKKNFPSFQIIEMPCTSEMWTKFGKKAGHIRNVQMLESALDHAVSTHHSSGEIPVQVDVKLLSALEPKVTWTYDYKKRQTGGTLHCTQAGVELFGIDDVKFIWESPERRELWRAYKAEFDAKQIHQLSLLTNKVSWNNVDGTMHWSGFGGMQAGPEPTCEHGHSMYAISQGEFCSDCEQ